MKIDNTSIEFDNIPSINNNTNKCIDCSLASSGLQWINHSYNYCFYKANDYKNKINNSDKTKFLIMKNSLCSNFIKKEKHIL